MGFEVPQHVSEQKTGAEQALSDIENLSGKEYEKALVNFFNNELSVDNPEADDILNDLIFAKNEHPVIQKLSAFCQHPYLKARESDPTNRNIESLIYIKRGLFLFLDDVLKKLHPDKTLSDAGHIVHKFLKFVIFGKKKAPKKWREIYDEDLDPLRYKRIEELLAEKEDKLELRKEKILKFQPFSNNPEHLSFDINGVFRGGHINPVYRKSGREEFFYTVEIDGIEYPLVSETMSFYNPHSTRHFGHVSYYESILSDRIKQKLHDEVKSPLGLGGKAELMVRQYRVKNPEDADIVRIDKTD